VAQTELHVHMVQHADADDRVERAAVQAVAGLDVADDDLGAVADARAAACGGRLAQLDRDELAAGLDEAPCELAGSRPELEVPHPRGEPPRRDQEIRTALRADRSRRPAPAPDALQVVRDDLLALAP